MLMIHAETHENIHVWYAIMFSDFNIHGNSFQRLSSFCSYVYRTTGMAKTLGAFLQLSCVIEWSVNLCR